MLAKKSVLLVCLLVSTYHTLGIAKQNKVLEGTYIPLWGEVKSMEVSRPHLGQAPTQLGKFTLELIREDWWQLSKKDKRRIKRKITIKGVFGGEYDPTSGTLSHVFTNKNRTGALYTQQDLFLPIEGDPLCASGVPMIGTEQLNFVAGTGIFANLASGTLYAQGVVNNCPSIDKFMQNDFGVSTNKGSLTFTPVD